MKIALAQLNSQDDWRTNLMIVGHLVEKAARRSADAILFPENTFYMGDPKHLYRVAHELENGQALRAISAMARIHRIAILIGSYPETVPRKRKVFNTSVWIDEKGNELARYRKIHLFDVVTPEGARYRESGNVNAGKKRVLFRWRGVRIGLSICYDIRFPEHYRPLSLQGAEWLMIPSAFTYETGKAHWNTLVRSRAIENLATVFAPAQTGSHPQRRQTFGHSLVVSPWGKYLCDSGSQPKLAIVNVKTGKEKLLRKRFPVLSTIAKSSFL